jgi:ParB family chromosome partitioning protein
MSDSSRSKSVLGKGLGALIPRMPVHEEPISPSALPADTGGTGVIVAVEISKVRSNPYQPRLDFDPKALEELQRSIVEKGVIQPITVRRAANGMYELISGERRVRACQMAGVKNIPAYIIHVNSDEEMLELALIENLQREHLNPIEIGLSYQRLIDECRFTQEDVAQKIGKDRSTVTNFIRLLKLPQKIQDSLRKDDISMGHARALISIPDEKLQLRLYEKIIKQGLSVRKVEQLVKDTAVTKGRKNKQPTGGSHSHTFQNLETRLRQSLGTKVNIKQKPDGAGEIVIEYYNPDDLDRLIEMLERE